MKGDQVKRKCACFQDYGTLGITQQSVMGLMMR